MSWKAEVTKAWVCGMSRLRNDFAALEYSERRVASMLKVELESAPAAAAGTETMVVVRDMEGRGYHMYPRWPRAPTTATNKKWIFLSEATFYRP